MDLLWVDGQSVTVREVLAKLNANRQPAIAYTTVMTVMTHLNEKGLLERQLVGQTYRYQIALSREEFLRHASKQIVEELVSDFGDAAIASFLETMEQVDPERLARLQRYLAAEDLRR